MTTFQSKILNYNLGYDTRSTAHLVFALLAIFCTQILKEWLFFFQMPFNIRTI